jgi:hypothetical protein
MSVAPVRAEDDIRLAQMSTNAHSDGFLANVSVAGSVNQTALMCPGELLLTAANQHHLAVQFQEEIPVQLIRELSSHGWSRRF